MSFGLKGNVNSEIQVYGVYLCSSALRRFRLRTFSNKRISRPWVMENMSTRSKSRGVRDGGTLGMAENPRFLERKWCSLSTGLGC